ncbi:MAG: universal stress protein [Nitrospirae bacterium]|nr:universal stress protein [Nitrospirota bacterium]
MGKYRKLLVAIDGSKPSMHALKESFRIAALEKCWIIVCSVVPPYEGDLELISIRNIQDIIRQPCEKALAEAISIAKSSGALIRTVCEEGEPYERIIDLAEAENCDLIIMGRTGQHEIDGRFIGNVTSRVIGYSPIDVLVVPNGTSMGWERILIATDGSRYSDAATLKALDFARAYGSALSVVSVVDVPAEFIAEAPDAAEKMFDNARRYVGEVKQLAEAAGIKVDAFVKEGEAFESIVSLAGDNKIDMMIMGSHGRTGLKRLLIGSVAEKVIGHAPCPVLVARL